MMMYSDNYLNKMLKVIDITKTICHIVAQAVFFPLKAGYLAPLSTGFFYERISPTFQEVEERSNF